MNQEPASTNQNTPVSIKLIFSDAERANGNNSWAYHSITETDSYQVQPANGPEDRDSAGNPNVYILSGRDGSRIWVPLGKYTTN